MAGDFESIVRAIEQQDPSIGDMPIPHTYLAATLHKSDEQMFAGRASRDKDPRKSLHIEQVPTPELAAGEALIAVMASCDQLQHGVVLDIRARLDIRIPRSLCPEQPRRSPAPTGTTTSWALMLPALFFRPVPESIRGSRAIAWSPTACRWNSSLPSVTTTQ